MGSFRRLGGRASASVGLRALGLLIGCGTLGSCGPEGPTHARIRTPEGTVRVLLYDQTPVHRDNFDSLARTGFYDSLLFHRVIAGFMAQGGDPSSRETPPNVPLGMGDPGYTLPAEIGAPHLRGALAAARSGGPGNPDKRSNGSQFYVVAGRPVGPAMLADVEKARGFTYNAAQRELYASEGGRPDLDGEYTVFGEVVEGIDVIDRITARQTNAQDRPLEDVWMIVEIE